jgi:hypothetical protein
MSNVANSRFGRFSKVRMDSFTLVLLRFISSILTGVREKNAVSDPEISAEQTIRSSINTNEAMDSN